MPVLTHSRAQAQQWSSRFGTFQVQHRNHTHTYTHTDQCNCNACATPLTFGQTVLAKLHLMLTCPVAAMPDRCLTSTRGPVSTHSHRSAAELRCRLNKFSAWNAEYHQLNSNSSWHFESACFFSSPFIAAEPSTANCLPTAESGGPFH